MNDRGIVSALLQIARIALGQLSYLPVTMASCKRQSGWEREANHSSPPRATVKKE